MEGYIHEPTHYYYFDNKEMAIYSNPKEPFGIIRRRRFEHLSEAIQVAVTLQAPIDIYNSDGIIVHSLPIHEF